MPHATVTPEIQVKASTLRCWSSKLPKSTTAPEIARVQVVRSRAERQGPGEVVVEMGNARVRVSEGVDMALVRQVLALATEVA